MRDPYEVLGVGRNADSTTIKNAYRKLARAHHPDVRPDDKQAEDRFKEIAAAYDFLSDETKKAAYDRGEIDASGAPRAPRGFYREYADARRGAHQTDPSDPFAGLNNADLFAELFRGVRRDARKLRGQDIRHRLEIDFLDAVNGAQRDVALADGRRLKVTIPKGAVDGQTLRLKGQGQPGLAGGPAGDLHLELSVRSHPIFSRQDNDIYSELPVTLGEAVLGARVEVPTVDGSVSMIIPGGSNTGKRLRVRGKGLWLANGKRGDHYVTLRVVLPDPPDPELTRLIEAWAPAHPYRVR